MHDNVLEEISTWLDQCRMEKPHRKHKQNQRLYSSTKEEGKPSSVSLPRRSQVSTVSGIMSTAQTKLRFPEEIAVTSLRPDKLLLSRSSRTVHIVELIVPWEDRLGISHEFKTAKYQDLVGEALIKGWKASPAPIEVGCRRSVAVRTSNILCKTGLAALTTKKTMKSISASAETSSLWLWIKRETVCKPTALISIASLQVKTLSVLAASPR